MLNILGKRYLFFAISLLIIIPGLILALVDFPLSIDFTGGSFLEVRLESGEVPGTEEMIQVYNRLGIEASQVQTTDQGSIVVRSSLLTRNRGSASSPRWKRPLRRRSPCCDLTASGLLSADRWPVRAGLAVAIAALAVVIYITYAFRGVPHAFRYGVCAIIAMLHDVAIVISLGVDRREVFRLGGGCAVPDCPADRDRLLCAG